jgi:hypothetical protein
MNFNSLRRNWLPLLLIVGMTVLFYYPVLFQHKTQIHAEGVSLGIALMHMLSSALQGESSLLWTTSIYGGHPIFAEGQGGFANPLHLLLAWLLPAVPAYNVNQFLCMLLSGIGTFGMSRAAGCSRAAASFAALALVFSTLWIGGMNNLAIGSTIAWIPWAFWGMQSWLKRADLSSACFFGVAMALMVVSGYPQIVHGVLIYMTIYLAVQLIGKAEPMMALPRLKGLVVTMLLAITLCIGLSAVQWLPLLELAGESHRSEGVSIVFLDSSSTAAFLRGFLYTFNNPGDWPNIPADAEVVYFTALGSLLVSLIFSLFIFFRRSVAINGHLLATLLLVILGFGRGGTPLFEFLYDFHLVPGLHSFRVTFTYLWIAMVGFALVSAMTLDKLAESVPASPDLGLPAPGKSLRLPSWTGFPVDWRQLLFIVSWMVLWLLAIAYLHVDDVLPGQYYVAIACLVLFVIASVRGMRHLIPLIAVVFLSIEVIAFRVNTFNFGDASLIAKPQSIRSLEQDHNLRDFKFHDITLAGTYSLYHPKSPAVPKGLETMLAAVTPASNTLWGVSSLTGNLALGLKRRSLADTIIRTELRHDNDRTPGLRLIDFVSMKYLSVGHLFAHDTFTDAYQDDDLQVRIVENSFAHPRFQFFTEALAVPTMEQAAEALNHLQRPVLVIEAPVAPLSAGATQASSSKPAHRVIHDRSGLYVLEFQAEAPAWFFLADTNYPGWNAYLDGIQTPLYSAQLLGKAVYIPAGSHRLTLAFEPQSVRIGLALSILTLCVMLLLLGYRWRKPSPQRSRRIEKQ